MEVIQQFFEAEKERTAVRRRQIDADLEGQRLYDQFETERARAREEAERQRFEFVRSLAWDLFALGVIIIGVLFLMAFFEDDKQRAVAETLGKNGLIGLAGFGILSGLVRIMSGLMKK